MVVEWGSLGVFARVWCGAHSLNDNNLDAVIKKDVRKTMNTLEHKFATNTDKQKLFDWLRAETKGDLHLLF